MASPLYSFGGIPDLFLMWHSRFIPLVEFQIYSLDGIPVYSLDGIPAYSLDGIPDLALIWNPRFIP